METQLFESLAQATDSHASTTQIEPRVCQALEALGTQVSGNSNQSTDSHASTTQIEPRVAEIASKVAVDVEAQKDAAGGEAQEFQNLAAALTKVSLSAPEARLVIVYPHDSGQDLGEDPGVIRLPHMLSGLEPFGIMQGTENAAFDFHLPVYKQTLKEPCSRILTNEPGCQILYEPESNDCYLAHFVIETGTEICLTNAEDPSARECMAYGQPLKIKPGVWRVIASISSDGGHSQDYHLVNILVLERNFSISIRRRSSFVLMKREAIEDKKEDDARSTKRQKTETLPETGFAPAEGVIPTQLDRDADICSKASTSHMLVNENSTGTLLDLEDGDLAIIQSLVKGEKDAYQLQRSRNIVKNETTSVFTCRHSMTSKTIVAKVLRYNSQNVVGIARMWKQEKTLLEKISHKNIVELKAVDGRMFAIYLEFLPRSLSRGLLSPFKPSDAWIILRDIASALAYLATQRIFHNDIKPGNIAYSPRRGAVLLDFGLASTRNVYGGGTPFYIPPEFLERKSRGSAGDVWALGVTMLYVLGTMPLPDRGKGWLIHEASDERSDARKRMQEWLKHIARHRRRLNREDVVESLVYRMLYEQVASRMEAAAIELALKEREEVA